MATPKKPDNIVVTPPFRAAFVSVFTPKPVSADDLAKDPNKKPRYEVTMIFPPDVNLAPLKDLIRKTVEEKFPDPKKRPAGLRNPIRSGDEGNYPNLAGFAGNVFAAARSIDTPQVVDERLQPILDVKKLYSGCWCRAAVSAYYYDKKGNKGVNLDLKHIQFLKDDEPFVIRTKPEDVFGDDTEAPPEAADGDDMFA